MTGKDVKQQVLKNECMALSSPRYHSLPVVSDLLQFAIYVNVILYFKTDEVQAV